MCNTVLCWMSYDITHAALEHYLQTPVMNSQPSKTELILLVLLLFCSLSHRNPARLKETLRTTKANISSPSLEMGTAECVPRHTACPACSPNHKGQGFTTPLSWQLHLDLQQPCCHIRGLGAATSWKDKWSQMPHCKSSEVLCKNKQKKKIKWPRPG